AAMAARPRARRPNGSGTGSLSLPTNTPPLASVATAPVAGPFRWFVRGDIDGFFGLAIDNLVQLLVIVALCRSVLGFSDELFFRRVVPGAGGLTLVRALL